MLSFKRETPGFDTDAVMIVWLYSGPQPRSMESEEVKIYKR